MPYFNGRVGFQNHCDFSGGNVRDNKTAIKLQLEGRGRVFRDDYSASNENPLARLKPVQLTAFGIAPKLARCLGTPARRFWPEIIVAVINANVTVILYHQRCLVLQHC